MRSWSEVSRPLTAATLRKACSEIAESLSPDMVPRGAPVAFGVLDSGCARDIIAQAGIVGNETNGMGYTVSARFRGLVDHQCHEFTMRTMRRSCGRKGNVGPWPSGSGRNGADTLRNTGIVACRLVAAVGDNRDGRRASGDGAVGAGLASDYARLAASAAALRVETPRQVLVAGIDFRRIHPGSEPGRRTTVSDGGHCVGF